MAMRRAPGPGQGQFGVPSPRPSPRALGVFMQGPARPYGYPPHRYNPHNGLGETPALLGFFRAGRTVGVSAINAMATNIRRG